MMPDDPMTLVEQLWGLAERLTDDDEVIVSSAADRIEQLQAELSALDMVMGLRSDDPRDRVAHLKHLISA